MNLGNILIVGAHLDDIEVGLGGFLSSLYISNDVPHIYTYIACCGLNKPDIDRKNTFITNMENINIRHNIIDKYLDTAITEGNINNIKEVINDILEAQSIQTVFVINSDGHKDHRKVFEMVRLCTRQSRSKVKRVYSYQVYTDFNLKEFNCTLPFNNELKYNMLQCYNQKLNINLIRKQDEVFGANTNGKYAEKVRIIYDTLE